MPAIPPEHLTRALGDAIAASQYNLCQPLGPIFLPPDPGQRPAPEWIRRANRFRQIE